MDINVPVCDVFFLDVKTHATCLDASVRRTEDNLECVYKGCGPSVDAEKV